MLQLLAVKWYVAVNIRRDVKMYKYEFVTIGNEKFMGAKYTRHRNIIDEYAKNGYRYVGFIPTKTTDWGKFMTIDLVFEKQEGASKNQLPSP